ncbi:MAG: class I tRNA ligase family protein [Candidatus Peribacteria bacterium]|nr:MAG: class I tRNA ligase family protein [Candidatus Peribacteria bacterium]
MANDQVVDGCCERCKSEIIQKKMPQWFIKITDYADRLISDLDSLDWPEETKLAQKNWIGKSEGAEIDFLVKKSPPAPLAKGGGSNEERDGGIAITVFTTRPDTIYGVTALVLAPESLQLDKLLTVEHRSKVEEYRKQTMAKTSVQRQQDAKEKSGVFSGLYAEHPLTGESIPVWYADYVLPDYATGSIMLVPGHDERDFEFAQKFGIDLVQVISGPE